MKIWTDQEKDLYVKELKKHGKDFVKIQERFPDKTVAQCRNFFMNNKFKGFGFAKLSLPKTDEPEAEEVKTRAKREVKANQKSAVKAPVKPVVKKRHANSGANWKGNRWTKLKAQQQQGLVKIDITKQAETLETQLITEALAGKQRFPGKSLVLGDA